jgi:hypothetical protein
MTKTLTAGQFLDWVYPTLAQDKQEIDLMTPWLSLFYSLNITIENFIEHIVK